MTRPTILLVDDEFAIQNALKRVLRPDGYRVLTADNGAAALAALDRENIDVLISDFRMPGMSGIELLGQASLRHPEVGRIMLSGQADLNAVIRAMNDGAIAKYLPKPWDASDLRNAVHEALETARLVTADDTPFPGLPSSERLGGPIQEIRTEAPGRRWIVAVEITNAARSLALLTRPQVEQVGLALLRTLEGTDLDISGVCAVDRSIISFVLTSAELQQAISVVARALGKPLLLPWGSLLLRCRLGATELRPGEGAGTSALSKAVTALSAFEDDHSLRLAVLTDDMSDHLQRRATLEQDLHQALAAGDIYCVYQPQVSAEDFRIASAETLVRWQHPTLGMISPLVFVELAERCHLIDELGRYVLERGLFQLRRLGGCFDQAIRISINVSPREFADTDLVGRLSLAVRHLALEPERIEIEITESSAMQDFGRARRVLSELRELGVRIALDDFGTGYSSLAQLHKLPLDVLKFDRSFVRFLDEDPASRKLLKHVSDLARDLKLEVVAEGVETLEQAEACRAQGCNLLQGFYFHKPMLGADLERILRSERHAISH